MASGVDLNITVSRTETRMTVLVMPKVSGLKDPGQNHIVPFTLTGAPAEIDQGFFPALQQPVQKTAALLTNMAAFEKQADAAAANAKAAKTEKDKADKEAKDKKSKYDGFVAKADEQEKAGNTEGTITNLQQARLHATEKEQKALDERIAKLRASQGDLFGDMAAQPAAAVAPQPQAVPAQPVDAPPVQQPQPAQPVQGAPMPQAAQPQPGTYPGQGQQVAGEPAAQPAGYPQAGYGAGQPAPGTQPPQNGYGVFSPQQPPQGQPYVPQPYPSRSAGAGIQPNTEFGNVYNPADYEGMPDVQFTHVGQQINSQL